jgi:hypothetical protein
MNKYRRFRSGRGVTNGIRANPHDFTDVCGLVVRDMAHGACEPRVVTWHWHMTTLDTHTWPRWEVPSLGLIDKDADLLRGGFNI